MLGRDHDLVDIFRLEIDGDEADQRAVRFRQHDARRRHQFLAPAFAPPVDARVKVDFWVVLRPGPPPQLDRRVLVSGAVGPQRGFRAHRSVSLNSMRRLRLYASSVVPVSIGWNSPKPAATNRCGETPLATRYCTTAIARAADRPQFDLNWPPVMGRTSVWPSTRNTQGISVGICFSRLASAPATLSSSVVAACSRSALPVSKNSSDCSTKRSPTMRTSGRLPRISRSLPKKSERYLVSSCTFCASATFSLWPRSAMRFCASLSFCSEALSATSMAANCRRRAAICWLRISTCASALEEIFFSPSIWPESSETFPCDVAILAPAPSAWLLYLSRSSVAVASEAVNCAS